MRGCWLPVGAALLMVGAGLSARATVEAQRARASTPPATSPQRPASRGTPDLPAHVRQAPLPDARSPRNANYSIDVRLDPDRRLLTGRQTLTWRNVSARPTRELQYHLYYNAWRNTRSTWMREAARGRRLRTVPGGRGEREWGWVDVTAIRLVGAGGAPPLDLTPTMRFLAPDDGNPDDRTVLKVLLPAPVEPGETINVELDWTSQIPRTFARTGAIGRYFFIAQWFPKVGVLEDGGWNCHQFHSGTEFFSDYGVYDVRITVPRGWVVGATGIERDTRENADATTVHRYYQEDVHDFAWTTSPTYLVEHARFSHPGLPPVEMRLLLQPEHAGQAARHFAATRAALRYYGQWFGPYPYPQITIVDPAWQSGAGGMEYPTLFTAGTRWLAPVDVTTPEGVTIHECGHQFWYAIVGNNEFEHAWLDEGLNTFSTGRTVAEAYTPNYQEHRVFGSFIPLVLRDLPVSRATGENGLDGYRRGARLDAPSTASWRYAPGAGGALSYNKTALWLHTLERHLGWPTLQRILSTFFRRWQFRHPTPQDFFDTANEISGRDLTWFFDQVHRSSNVFDYAIEDLQSGPIVDSGIFDRGRQHEHRTAEVTPERYRTTVVVRRVGEAVFPVDVLVTFRNGEKVREHWHGRDRWIAYTYERGAEALSAVVDPDRVLLLDVNITNNSRTLEPLSERAAAKWSALWMGWLQDLLLTFAFFV